MLCSIISAVKLVQEGNSLCIADHVCFFCGFSLANIWKADLLARYGGVAPKMAEEAHALVIDQVWLLRSRGFTAFWGSAIYVNCIPLFFAQVVQKALDDAKLSGSDLSAVAVTVGPGLSLCLRGMDVPPICSLDCWNVCSLDTIYYSFKIFAWSKWVVFDQTRNSLFN